MRRLQIIMICMFVFCSVGIKINKLSLSNNANAGESKPFEIRITGITASSVLESKEMYSPKKLFDGNPGTAWVEGESDEGIGSTITIEFDKEIPVEELAIYNGLQIKKYFKLNNRVKELEITSDTSEWKRNVILEDRMGKQLIKFSTNWTARKLTIKIKSVYKGTKWNDTPISEIVFTSSVNKDCIHKCQERACSSIDDIDLLQRCVQNALNKCKKQCKIKLVLPK